MLRILILIAFCISSATIAGELAENKKDFYSDRERGWYFYEKEPVKDDKKEVKKDKFEKPVVDWKALENMHPKEFEKLFSDVRAYTLMYPTEENMVDYYRFTDIYLNRARKFQEVFTYVAQTHPELSKEDRYPVSKIGQDELFKEKKERIDKVLQVNAENYALLYFYSPECGYCIKQTPILEYFIEETGWTIKPIDITTDQRAAARFNIQATPSLVMIKKNSKDWIFISSGIISLADLKERVVRSIGE